MPSLMAMFASLAAKLPARVFAALGIGMVTFTAFSAGVSALIATAQTQWAGLPADTLTILSMANIDTALGIVLGAVVARVAIQALPRIGVLPGGSS